MSFQSTKNEEEDEEPFVVGTECNASLHDACKRFFEKLDDEFRADPEAACTQHFRAFLHDARLARTNDELIGYLWSAEEQQQQQQQQQRERAIEGEWTKTFEGVLGCSRCDGPMVTFASKRATTTLRLGRNGEWGIVRQPTLVHFYFRTVDRLLEQLTCLAARVRGLVHCSRDEIQSIIYRELVSQCRLSSIEAAQLRAGQAVREVERRRQRQESGKRRIAADVPLPSLPPPPPNRRRARRNEEKEEEEEEEEEEKHLEIWRRFDDAEAAPTFEERRIVEIRANIEQLLATRLSKRS